MGMFYRNVILYDGSEDLDNKIKLLSLKVGFFIGFLCFRVKLF
jgi:hypothetical protein